MPTAVTAAASALLNPHNHTLLLIDHQSQMAFATHSIDVVQLRNNAAMVAKASQGFGVATIVTSVARNTFSGPLFPELVEIFKHATVYDRTSMNCWEDDQVTAQVNVLARDRLVFAGLWTSVCIVGPVLSAIEQGFEVCVIADACGDITTEAHERAMQRMLQAGAVPMTSLQYLLELQRDWARGDTYAFTTGVAQQHAGGYGLGIQYAGAMFGAHEGGQ